MISCELQPLGEREQNSNIIQNISHDSRELQPLDKRKQSTDVIKIGQGKRNPKPEKPTSGEELRYLFETTGFEL